MADAVSLDEAKLFLRVSHDDEDALITTLIAAAIMRLAGVVAVPLDNTAPAPLRLCLLWLVAQGYTNRGDMAADLDGLETWLAPYRQVRL